MNKILLALAILGAGAGGFLTARQSTTQLQHEANAAREAWLTQTQLVAVAQSEQAGLVERVRELKQALAQPPAVAGSALWSALQTNRADRLPPELREHLLKELGFNWQSSEAFVVVSKNTVRQIQMQPITPGGKLTDMAATVLAMTPAERGQVEAAMQRVQTDFKDWALARVERSEPKDDVMAHYSLPGDPTMSQSITNSFATALFDALGRERAELIIFPSAYNWMFGIGILDENAKPPITMIVKRYMDGDEPRLRAEVRLGTRRQKDGATPFNLSQGSYFPPAFRPIFPKGWADVAKREGFELPEEPQKK